MSCANPQWSVRFPQVEGEGGPFEIRPSSLTLRMERDSYDYARARFPVEVGKVMKTETGGKNGRLRSAMPVEVCVDGELIHTLYYKPDLVEYYDNGVSIEFHDLQESMDSGVIDKHWTSVTLEEAYTYVFEKRDTTLIEDIKFAVPETNAAGWARPDTLVGEFELEPAGEDDGLFGTGWTTNWVNDKLGDLNRRMFPSEMRKVDEDATRKLMDSYYAIDFKDVSPAAAIWELNKRFSVTSWVDRDRTLWIGIPETQPQGHIAAPDDPRVWRYVSGDVQIRHAREPVFAVIAKGQWVDEPGIGTGDDIVSWFNPGDEDGFGDVRAEGVAFAPQVDPEFGQTLEVDASDAKRDALPYIAHMKLMEKTKQQHTGTVQLSPEFSGEDISKLSDLTVGDSIRLVPDDQWFENPTGSSGRLGDEPEMWNHNCGQFVNNELYMVTGVTHSIEGRSWTVTADVTLYPDFSVQRFTRYFDPRSEDYVSEEDVFGTVQNFWSRFRIEDF